MLLLFYFLFKRLKFGRIKKLYKRNIQTVAKHFQGDYTGVFATVSSETTGGGYSASKGCCGLWLLEG